MLKRLIIVSFNSLFNCKYPSKSLVRPISLTNSVLSSKSHNNLKPGLHNRLEKCRKNIRQANDALLNIELMSKQPETYIGKYFEEIKQKLDIQRQKMTLKIENDSKNIKAKINQAQRDCMEFSKSVNDQSHSEIWQAEFSKSIGKYCKC